jgi:GT2 family glycosyltransferase
MKVAAIIIGVRQWKQYTLPMLKSMVKHQPDARIILVDNGNHYPEEYTGVEIVKTNKILDYSAAINVGFCALDDEEWVLIINNDVLCKAPYFDQLKKFRTDTIYGNSLHYDFRMFHHRHIAPFTDGWIITMPREIIDAVGDFDTNFKIACAEDADYCFRAAGLGYKVAQSDLPFKHLKAKTRRGFDNFKQQRLDNIAYLVDKHELEWK